MSQPLLEIENLAVSFKSPAGQVDVTHGFNLSLQRGETIGIVGESGSGKTLSMLAMTRLLPAQAFVSSGAIRMGGTDLLALDAASFHRQISGRRVSMIFQEPMTALNPVYSIGRQLTETMIVHEGLSASVATARALEMLEAVKMPQPRLRMNQYPHQLSGGQRQRIMIAMALMNKPDVLVADEPTTALDVTVQDEIIKLLVELQQQLGMAMIFISHDLGVVSRVSERVIVMRKGETVERGETKSVLQAPSHEYTQGLLQCLWRLEDKKLSTESPHREPILRAEGIAKRYKLSAGLLKKSRKVDALKETSFSVYAGETLAIVGESGSGKSTLAKIINGLISSDRGKVTVENTAIEDIPVKQRARLIQPIFQDPYSTLNPTQTIGQIVARPLHIHKTVAAEDIEAKTLETMQKAGLSADFVHRFPGQLSGGQRQRVAIARAIILQPRILICDEPTSALDVSIQAQILDLLCKLQRELQMTLVVISHDMAVVGYLADRVFIMLDGELIESGSAAEVLQSPRTAYAKKLMSSVYRVPRASAS